MFPKLPKPKMIWFLYVGIALMLAGTAYQFAFPQSEPQPATHGELAFHDRTQFWKIQELVEKDPKSVTGITFLTQLGKETPTIVLTDGKESLWANVPGKHDYDLLSQSAADHGVRKDAKFLNAEKEYNMPADGGGFVGQLMVSIIVMIVISGAIAWFMNKRGQGNGGPGKHGKITLTRLDQVGQKVTFADVAGIDDELDQIKALVFDIKHPEILTKLGGKVPAGVTLEGPPGTGKTYLVQAISGEGGDGEKSLPVFTCSGGDFVDQFVGTGASRVRDAFEQCRKLRDELNSWVILFIDEFDAVGKHRSGGASGGNDERDQTVGQLLVELQGSAGDNARILVIIATNKPEVLDPALVRSGRLGDKKITVTAPDRAGRLAILSVKIKKVPAADDVDLGAIADEMTGLTGADIDTLITKRAPEFAKKRLVSTVPAGMVTVDSFKPEQYKIIHADIWKALEDMIMGTITETKGRRLDPMLKHMIAVHELGHFVLAYRKYLQNTGKWDGQYGDAITAISILGPSGVGGFVRTVPPHDFKTAKGMKSFITIALAGNRSERMFLGDKTGGCSNDLQQAMRFVKAMLLQFNMSDCNNEGWKLPAISVDQQGGTKYLGGQTAHAAQYGMSDFSATQVDAFIDLFLNEAETEADAYLAEEADFIKWMAPRLVKAERMRFPEIKADWDEFHQGRDLSKAVAFPYLWDDNHVALNLPRVELKPVSKPVIG